MTKSRTTVPRAAQLVLADGEVFEGELIGADTERTDGIAGVGEVVFNTSLAGYQEIITDPSYAGQIITFTYPHIGNYGTTGMDDESARPACRGVIVRDLARRASSWRSDRDLSEFLGARGLSGLAGIDTRRLTRHLRDAGAMPGAYGTSDRATLLEAARADGGTDGRDLVAEVTTSRSYEYGFTDRISAEDGTSADPFNIVAIDYGIKRTILRHLVRVGCGVWVVPASTSAAEILAMKPDGVFLSNGPGDPDAVAGAAETVGALVGNVPLFGICLGHQILGLALGGTTYKLPFGHHGGNHPVRHEASGRIEITSQNHNYVVDPESLRERVAVTHRNLNDGTLEGMRVLDAPAFSVQYHPEAGPGPHDAAYLFDDFIRLMRTGETSSEHATTSQHATTSEHATTSQEKTGGR